MFGATPAQGFYLRHIRDIDMSHIEIASLSSDHRPDFVLDDVEGADFLRIRTRREPGVPVFSLHGVNNFSSYLSQGVADTKRENVGDESL